MRWILTLRVKLGKHLLWGPYPIKNSLVREKYGALAHTTNFGLKMDIILG